MGRSARHVSEGGADAIVRTNLTRREAAFTNSFTGFYFVVQFTAAIATRTVLLTKGLKNIHMKQETVSKIAAGTLLLGFIFAMSKLIFTDDRSGLFLWLSLFLAMFVSLIVFWDRVVEFSLKDFNVKLREVREARKEVVDKTAEIEEIAAAVTEIACFQTAFANRWQDNNCRLAQTSWLIARVDRMMQRAVRPESKGELPAVRWLEETRRIDNLREKPGSDEKADIAWDLLHREMLRLAQEYISESDDFRCRHPEIFSEYLDHQNNFDRFRASAPGVIDGGGADL